MGLVKHTASGSKQQHALTQQRTKSSQEERALQLVEELLPVMQCVCARTTVCVYWFLLLSTGIYPPSPLLNYVNNTF